MRREHQQHQESHGNANSVGLQILPAVCAFAGSLSDSCGHPQLRVTEPKTEILHISDIELLCRGVVVCGVGVCPCICVCDGEVGRRVIAISLVPPKSRQVGGDPQEAGLPSKSPSCPCAASSRTPDTSEVGPACDCVFPI